MEGSNGSNGVQADSGPIDESGERMKSEQEKIARAIASVGHEDFHWDDLAPEQREVYLEMAVASVDAAMPPLPTHENAPEPPYPAELLDLLAEELAYKMLNPGHFRERVREALDRYTQEVGRENVPDLVAKAIAEL